MAVSAGDVVRVVLPLLYQGKVAQNVFHMKLIGSGDLADGAFMTNALSKLTAAYTNIVSFVKDSYSYGDVEFFNVTQDRPMGLGILGAGADPVSPAEALPPAVAALAKFGTIVARSQGRKFVAGLSTAGKDGDGSLTATFLGAMAAYAAELALAQVIGAFEIELGNWNDTLQRFASWVDSAVSTEFKTQRRRYISAGI